MPEDVGELPYQTIRDNKRISVVLPDMGYLDQTGFKVLQSVAGVSLLCGHQSMLNDKVKLTYDISHCVPLAEQAPSLTAEQVLGVARELMDTQEHIYSIGFLKFENICLRPEDIFLDSNSYRVYLIYLPIRDDRTPISRPEFDRAFRICLRWILDKAPAACRLARLREALASELTIPEIRERLRSGVYAPADAAPLPPPLESPPPVVGPRRGLGGRLRNLFAAKEKPAPETTQVPAAVAAWHLVGTDTPEPVDILLAGERVVVGRSPQSAQGVLGFNLAIGRVHCAFLPRGEQCFLEDMGSVNGTFINGTRMTGGMGCEVLSGDHIRLADSEFTLRHE